LALRIPSTIFGVPIVVGTTVFYLAMYMAVSTVVRDGYGGLAETIRFLIFLYASVLVHELAHAIVGRWRGIRTKEIALWALGGLARLDNPPARGLDDVIMTAAGPLSNVLLAVVAVCLTVAFQNGTAVLREFALVNIALALFNLLPIYPLDGGRMMHAVFRSLLPQDFAPRATAAVSQGLAALGTVILMSNGWWLEALFCLVVFFLAPLQLKIRIFWFLPKGRRTSHQRS
jgi:stage IV sporulation protein FB